MMKWDDFEHIYDEGNAGSPLFVLFHGTGGSPEDLVEFARTLSPACGILAGRGAVDENGHSRWFARHSEGVFDLDDLRRRTQGMKEWLDATREKYQIGDRQVFAMGYSNGANILANLLLQGHSFCRLAILLRPMVPNEPVENLDLSGVSVAINSGIYDELCPPEQGETLEKVFSASGAEVELNMITAGHNLVQADFQLLLPLVHRL